MTATVAVIAKAPLAGRSKTRLCPPLSLEDAAMLAEASLTDTLAAVESARVARRVVVLQGEPGAWLPPGIEVIPQRGAALDERLANAFVDIGSPALVIGMDTPQVEASELEAASKLLIRAPAVLGAASDGGYWAIGLRRPDPRALLGVPMSSARTLQVQRMRLRALRLDWVELAEQRDVDTYADAVQVAHQASATRFAAALASIGPTAAAA